MASWSASTWSTSTGSTSRATTPRWPGTASTTRWPTPSPTASSARSTPTGATTRTGGTPTSSPTRWMSSPWCSTRSCAGGGFTTGGFNFDTKLRRQSMDRTDLFHGHVGGIDAIAKALLAAAELIEDETLSGPLADRYAGWSGDLGAAILDGAETLDSLEARVMAGEHRPGAGVRSPGAAREPGEQGHLVGRLSAPARPDRPSTGFVHGGGRHRLRASVAGPVPRRGRRPVGATLGDDVVIRHPDSGVYRMRGGHRLWAAPEVPAVTYSPDDHRCEVVADPGRPGGDGAGRPVRAGQADRGAGRRGRRGGRSLPHQRQRPADDGGAVGDHPAAPGRHRPAARRRVIRRRRPVPGGPEPGVVAVHQPVRPPPRVGGAGAS